MRKSAYFVMLVGIFVGINMNALENAVAQDQEGQSKPYDPTDMIKGPMALAEAIYTEAGTKRHLTFLKSIIPDGGMSNEEMAAFRKKYNYRPFPNTAFTLVNSDSENLLGGRVQFLLHEYDNIAFPPTVWGAVIVRPAGKTNALLVLMKSKSVYVYLRVYQINPANALGVYPIELDPKHYEEWPRVPEPMAEIKRKIIDGHICGIASIKVRLENDQLRILGEREHENCPPIDFTFDLNSKEWQVTPDSSAKVETNWAW